MQSWLLLKIFIISKIQKPTGRSKRFPWQYANDIMQHTMN